MSPFKRKVLRIVSVYLLISFFTEWLFPIATFALTSGPAQPEFSSFEPVATTNMVNDFTGEFTYNLPVINVPGPNGSGYAASLSYHSGATMEEEASWVGYGWTLNPGAINRGKNGLPDDYNGNEIRHTNRMPANWTASAGIRLGVELMSADNGVGLASISATKTVRYNSYKGFGTSVNIRLAAYEGLGSLNYTVCSDEPHSFSAEINPGAIVTAKSKKKYSNKLKTLRYERDPIVRAVLKNCYSEKLQKANSYKRFNIGNLGSQYGLFSLFGITEERVHSVAAYQGYSYNISLGVAGTPAPLDIGLEGGVEGSFSLQEGEASYSRYGYGYMYLQDWNTVASAANMQADYKVEKESPFNKRDYYLPIPYTTPDVFQVTGEGIGGTFRLYTASPGHVKPTNIKSPTKILNEGADITFGEYIGGGANIGLGFHNLESKNWDDMSKGNTNMYGFATPFSSEKVFFRFQGDLGGNVEYSVNDDAYSADIYQEGFEVGRQDYSAHIDTSVIFPLRRRAGRSSYIGYHTNIEMMETQATNMPYPADKIYYKAYTKNNPAISSDASHLDDVEDPWDYVSDDSRTNNLMKGRIGEIATFNEDGHRYVYGLPVYAAKETSMAVSVKEPLSDMPAVRNNYLVYKQAEGNVMVGESKDDPYASAFLLTQITTPDYIDRKFDGPTSDDFGGWTKFNYRRIYGSNDKINQSHWYKWRFPYNGLLYEKHELSDPRDDMGSYSSGLKEIYMLKSIETKTHVAYFITNKTKVTLTDAAGNTVNLNGTSSPRPDALGAVDDATAALNETAKDETQTQERLEKIVLYAKDANNKIVGKPLKIVHFDYYEDGTDYTVSEVLCKNLPNAATVYSNGKNAGKLTLRRVWFEYEGTANSKIAPYEFKYRYKVSSDYKSADLIAKYGNIINYGTGLNENPDYNIYNTDNWGYYCSDGASRRAQLKNWINQGKQDPTFDPAAWQLKVIKLPSGGEILIQYEQNDYSHVQDQPALGMVSLLDNKGNGGPKAESNSEGKYYLNLNDIDIDQDGNGTIDKSEIDALTNVITPYLANNKVYFKFLYQLMTGDTPDVNSCGADYIDGYMNATVGYDDIAKNIYISFKSNGPYKYPYKVCDDFVKRTKAGLTISNSCNVARDAFTAAQDGKGRLALVKDMWQNNGKWDQSLHSQDYCRVMSLQNSYIRIPLLKAKKGGGVRVKRLLMHDAGLEPGANGDESLYGTEYIYKNADGTSSGVAANEPPASREENALIKFLDKRSKQSLIEKIIAGVDKENFEGPIGEELLPPPSVGYQRVIAQNIHTGKSGTGFKVTNFYTTFEYPLSSGVDMTSIDEKEDFKPLSAIFVTRNIHNKWVTQGYRFILNSMNGKQRRVATYAGTYDPTLPEDSYFKSYEEIYEYFEPGEKVPVMDENGKISNQYLGKESEVTMASSSVEDVQDDGHIQMDVGVGIFVIPVGEASFFPYFQHNEKKLRSHVTCKVIRYPAILKKTTVLKDGITHTTENAAFSKFTGQPLVTVTRDGYDNLKMEKNATTPQKGTYMSYSIPANYVYRQMGPKATNERFVYQNPDGLPLSGGLGSYSFTLPASDAGLINNSFIDGDLVRIDNAVLGFPATTGGLFFITGFNGNSVQLKSLTFVPASNFTFYRAEVISSGYTNQLNLSAGAIATYGTDYPAGGSVLPPSPLNISTGVLSQADFTKAIAATAQTYTDNWSNTIADGDYNYVSGNSNEYETGKRGKWRPDASYVWKKAKAIDAVSTDLRVYTDAGTFALSGFNYKDPSQNSNNSDGSWIKTNTVTLYSPHGEALEEKNVLDIRSSARFGYGENVPVLVARNAPYSSVLFAGFEGDASAVATTAHSGRYSYQLARNAEYSPGTISIDQTSSAGILDRTINSKGVSVKFWIKMKNDTDDDINTLFQCCMKNTAAGVSQAKLNKIARVGEWSLVEAKFYNMTYDTYTALTVKLKNIGAADVWIDDVRVQPVEAQVVCYVYDNTNLRLLTSFDDQHFGLYYQYNAEGKLLRKLVETERGMKTVQETQYNTPLQSR